ncbi:hypothetical protein [Calidifontibacillus oryziterrae]|uniref:hypothetical protein n=1 Tax=Calidifontibacillus oryziterrae TaxID=1191699 RepID=UPI0002E477AD|nr:hypothetical protein [Calidifontibacillus oryziterrae]
MINLPNYREFYQKALIPMNENDKHSFCTQYCKDDCDHCIKANHWLVALEGLEDADGKYKWSVLVYPAKETGVFWSLKVPYFKTSCSQTLEEAIEEAKAIEQKIVNSLMTAQTMMVN